MSLPPMRQALLDKELRQLRELGFVSDVQADDFDSISVDVIVNLHVARWMDLGSGRRAPHRFTVHMNYIKGAILRAVSVEATLLHWPGPRIVGEPIYREGYDCSHVKLEIFV